MINPHKDPPWLAQYQVCEQSISFYTKQRGRGTPMQAQGYKRDGHGGPWSQILPGEAVNSMEPDTMSEIRRMLNLCTTICIPCVEHGYELLCVLCTTVPL